MNAKKNKLSFKRKCWFEILFEICFSSLQFFSQSSNLLNQARLRVLKAREDHIKVTYFCRYRFAH
jgi:hypothetical protein